MINFEFSLSNPFSSRWDCDKPKSGLFTKHVAWEFNHYLTSTIVKLNFNIQPKGDHRGAFIWVGLLGHELEFHVYDTRHTDHY